MIFIQRFHILCDMTLCIKSNFNMHHGMFLYTIHATIVHCYMYFYWTPILTTSVEINDQILNNLSAIRNYRSQGSRGIWLVFGSQSPPSLSSLSLGGGALQLDCSNVEIWLRVPAWCTEILLREALKNHKYIFRYLERNWWELFQKHVVRTKFDVYFFINENT